MILGVTLMVCLYLLIELLLLSSKYLLESVTILIYVLNMSMWWSLIVEIYRTTKRPFQMFIKESGWRPSKKGIISLHENQIFELIKFSKGKRLLENKWVKKIKSKMKKSKPTYAIISIVRIWLEEGLRI